MKEVVVIGAGNLAWHLVQVLSKAGHDVSLISRDPVCVAEWPVRVLSFEELPKDPWLVFLAVPDDVINRVSAHLSQLLPSSIPVVHTSGATPAIMIHSHFSKRGAFWPIRSLRAGEEVTGWQNVPLVYHGSDAALTQVLGELAGKLSQLTYHLDDQQRAQLHLSAVFSNNFVTWLYQISYELCEQGGIPFEVLLPIIRNTALKQDGTAPGLTQTGAAARGDTTTMTRHLELLSTQPEYADLYRRMSRFIQAGVE